MRHAPGRLLPSTTPASNPEESRWERPGPTRDQLRRDVLGVLVTVAISSIALELGRGVGMLAGESSPIWLQHLVLALMIVPLVLRRRYPVAVMLVMSALFIPLSLWVPAVSIQVSFQAAYFASLYSAVAWAKDRRLLWLGTAVVVAAMALWLILALTVSTAYDGLLESIRDGDETSRGILEPLTSLALYNSLINVAYFGGAILIGMSAWRNAFKSAQIEDQAAQLARQSRELARRAVIEERLRIARELHDVVAHHVSLIGVQAGAARRVMDRKPEVAVESLRTIEQASRQTVSDMRNLLGVLRSDTLVDGVDDGRHPEPGLDGIGELARSQQDLGLAVEFAQVEDVPGALEQVSAPLALSLYRTAQESLTNIRRHSTASTAVLTLRTGRSGEQRWVELETVDDGRPRARTDTGSGSGYGLQGVRERVTMHRGSAEIGPRADGGWRVRARFPLT